MWGRDSGNGSSSCSLQTPIEPCAPRSAKDVQAIECDVTDIFESCVLLCAQLADAGFAMCPSAEAPFGPEMVDLEDGRGGARRRPSQKLLMF
eukprot:6259530-Pyramimonas_sp.AAC.1